MMCNFKQCKVTEEEETRRWNDCKKSNRALEQFLLQMEMQDRKYLMNMCEQ